MPLKCVPSPIQTETERGSLMSTLLLLCHQRLKSANRQLLIFALQLALYLKKDIMKSIVVFTYQPTHACLLPLSFVLFKFSLVTVLRLFLLTLVLLWILRCFSDQQNHMLNNSQAVCCVALQQLCTCAVALHPA